MSEVPRGLVMRLGAHGSHPLSVSGQRHACAGSSENFSNVFQMRPSAFQIPKRPSAGINSQSGRRPFKFQIGLRPFPNEVLVVEAVVVAAVAHVPVPYARLLHQLAEANLSALRAHAGRRHPAGRVHRPPAPEP